MVGIADLGEGGVEDENAVEATDVLVFMVSALNTTVWTLPIAYFFVAALSGCSMEQSKQCCEFL